MAASSAVPPNRQLPKKEYDLFKSIAKFYEIKQYKKGLKAADQVLKKFPNHGETQAMKGLCLSCVERKDEAYSLVKTALRNDMRSHVCWHVYGLLFRADHDYQEAIKCYKQALRIEKDNMTILRDISLLQIQMRDLAGFQETRRQILVQKPNSKLHWMGFAVASHLRGRRDQAVEIIDSYTGTQNKDPHLAKEETLQSKFEDSELVLYRNQLLSEKGALEEALGHLRSAEAKVVDRFGWLSKEAELLQLLGRFDEARDAWRRLLIDYAAENYAAHRGWQCALLELDAVNTRRMLDLKACDLPSTHLTLDEAQRATLTEAYDALRADLPKGRAVGRIPLTFYVGDRLAAGLRAYMERCLHSGVPALAADLSGLYTEPAGVGKRRRCKDPVGVAQHPTFQAVLALCDETLASLRSTGQFPSRGAAEPRPTEPPTSLLWCLFLKAQLEEARGDYELALELIDECIAHTPTAVDMYERRARLLRKSGDVAGAAEQMDAARRLDLADRYINNKATKYLLRAGRLEQAMSTIGLFTRHEGNPEYNLLEMQVMWVENEYGEAALRQGKYGLALKKFLAVEKHFNDFYDDLFDFHSYCLRKMTLRAYTAVLHSGETLQEHKHFQRAAQGAARTYLAAHDNPPEASQPQEPDYTKMTAAERKREKAKARKAAKRAADAKAEEEARQKQEAERKKAEEEKEEAAAAAAGDGKKKKSRNADRPIPVDDDPVGEKLLAKDHLTEALRLVKALVRHAPTNPDNLVLAYDTAVRRMKPLMALRSLFQSRPRSQGQDAPGAGAATGGGEAVDGGAVDQHTTMHPDVFLRTVYFATACDGAVTGGGRDVDLARAAVQAVSPPGKQALDEGLAKLLGGRSVGDFVRAYAAEPRTRESLTRCLAAAQAMLIIDSGASGKTAAADLVQTGGFQRRDVKVDVCATAHGLLRDEVQDAAAAEAWHAACSAKFPKSAAFGTPVKVSSAEDGDPAAEQPHV